LAAYDGELISVHQYHISCAQWKIQLGLDPSLEGYGCLSDLPDWSFVDWCPTPSGKGQSHWKQDNDAFVRLRTFMHVSSKWDYLCACL
uniref:Large ribosomal subunit protein mL52 n=1 Tax=Gopherus agassizii TaxID=38772 RepID=A0A452H745_9SAUR